MQILKYINQVVAFLLELAMFAAIGYWGYHQSKNTILKYVIALLLVAVAITLWGVFAAPKSAYRLNFPVRIYFELAMFLTAGFLLYKSNHTTLSICFIATAVLSETIAYIFEQ